MLLTLLSPQETIPSTPVVDRFGACKVPKTEAPLVTTWDSDGTKEGRATMLATAATAEAVMIRGGTSAAEGS